MGGFYGVVATGDCVLTNNGYRLPTEAEWEYAARGGLYTPYGMFPWGSDTNTDGTLANWAGKTNPFSTGAYPWTTPVGFYIGSLQYKTNYNWPAADAIYQTRNNANGFGLYDMSGKEHTQRSKAPLFQSPIHASPHLTFPTAMTPFPSSGGPVSPRTLLRLKQEAAFLKTHERRDAERRRARTLKLVEAMAQPTKEGRILTAKARARRKSAWQGSAFLVTG